MEFSRQEGWSRLPFPTPGDFLDPGIKAASLESSALAGGFFTTEPLFFLNYPGLHVNYISVNLEEKKELRKRAQVGVPTEAQPSSGRSGALPSFPAENSTSQPRPRPDQGRGEGWMGLNRPPAWHSTGSSDGLNHHNGFKCISALVPPLLPTPLWLCRSLRTKPEVIAFPLPQPVEVERRSAKGPHVTSSFGQVTLSLGDSVSSSVKWEGTASALGCCEN